MANMVKYLFFSFFILESFWCFSLVAASGAAAAADAIFSFENKCNTTTITTTTTTTAAIDINCSLIFPPSPSGSELIAVYFRPIQFSGPSPGFSTHFAFSSSSSSSFSFFLTLASLPLQYSPSLLSLTFTPSLAHHLHINVTGFGFGFSFSFPAINLNRRQKLHSCIDYDGTLHRLQLRLATSSSSKPILSYPINFNLSNLLISSSSQPMLLGFAASPPHNCTLHHWSFVARHGDGAPFLLHSDPLNPKSPFAPHPPSQKHPFITTQPRAAHSSPWRLVLALIFAAACGAMLTFFAAILCFSVCPHRRPVAPLDYSPDVLYSIKCSCSSSPPPRPQRCQLMPLPS